MEIVVNNCLAYYSLASAGHAVQLKNIFALQVQSLAINTLK